ncbi:tetratricopeptide repeat protein [Nitrosomonas sp.]|uniref:tetratricopeptide repeat protein n=1 Tax=Nitrosomonas sp. TaxID=42353 RepID=UPI0025E668BF|nr:tetratricopeptide repeat protein [Nitrosomonas sp.]
MTINCTQCGSSRIYKSRFRPGERTPSNFLLSPYRCRECKARFLARNNDAYFVTTISIGCIFLFGTLIWIGFSSDEPIGSNLPSQSQTAPAGSFHPTLQSAPVITSKKTIPEAIASGEKISLESIKGEETHSTSDPNDNRFYTINLFLEKAKKGNTDAQYQLGLLYLTGKGTLQDFSEASKWLTLAAEQNHPPAQYELGLLYQVGQGVEMDNEKSYIWFNLAAAAGIEQAALARDKVMRSLNRAQLASAQKKAREWLLFKSKSEEKLSGLIGQNNNEDTLITTP